MFGRKKNDDELKEAPDPSVEINTLPSEFYAGANPVITFRKVEKQIDISKTPSLLSPQDKKILDKETAVGSNQPLHPANLLTNKKFIAWAALAVFVLAGGGASVYYFFFQNKGAQKPIAAVRLPTSSPPDVVVFPTTTPIFDIPSSTLPITSTVKIDGKLEFPSVLLGDSADTDKDGLTDKEEEIFKTDLGVADTDNDSFTDGHEVFYLYNPAGKEPERLIDSGSVQEFVNPNYGYKFYYPISWKLGSVDPDFKDVLINTITGEFIEIRTFEKNSGEDFATWFGQAAPQEKYSELVEFDGYFNEKGRRRNDDLVYYFVTESKVYVVIYHPMNSSSINYRSIIKVVARSFRVDTTETTMRGIEVLSTSTTPTTTAATSSTGLRDILEKPTTSALTTTSLGL